MRSIETIEKDIALYTRQLASISLVQNRITQKKLNLLHKELERAKGKAMNDNVLLKMNCEGTL